MRLSSILDIMENYQFAYTGEDASLQRAASQEVIDLCLAYNIRFSVLLELTQRVSLQKTAVVYQKFCEEYNIINDL